MPAKKRDGAIANGKVVTKDGCRDATAVEMKAFDNLPRGAPKVLNYPDPDRARISLPSLAIEVATRFGATGPSVAFAAKKTSAWIKSLDRWDAYLRHNTPTNALGSIIAADDAGCFPAPVVLKWFTSCLREWNKSFASGSPISLDKAFGVDAEGRGKEPDDKRVARINRDQMLATHMAILTALGATDDWAAQMVAAEVARGKFRGPIISAAGIKKVWPQWKRDDNGYLRFAAAVAKDNSAAERKRYLSQFYLTFRPGSGPRAK